MTFVAGKRCKPILLYVILVVIVLSLVYFYVHRGGGSGAAGPANAPKLRSICPINLGALF